MNFKNITVESLIEIYDGNVSVDWAIKDFVNIIILKELRDYEFIFKGGTALYKQLEGDMHRFSEDIDLFIEQKEYKKSKKFIKETINNLIDYEIIKKVEFNEDSSGENTRIYNIYYSEEENSDTNIDYGKCQIEIALVGGKPTLNTMCDIRSIIKNNGESVISIPFTCVHISEILVDKLFIIMDNDKESYNKRNNRDFYDVFFIVNNFEININELLKSIENREQRNNHHLSGDSKYKPTQLLDKLHEYRDEFKNYWNDSNLFNDKPPLNYYEKYNNIIELIEKTK